MKRFLIVLLVMTATVAVWAQSSGIIGSGTLPATCTAARSIYLKTGAGAGFYICLATDTWTQVSATGGAPTTATYITQTADGTLSAEQDLGSLASGIMRSATTTGVVTVLTDSAGIAANLSDETGTGLVVFGTSATLTTPVISGIVVWPDDVRQTLNPGANAAGLNVGALAGDPGTPSNGDLWYDSTANELTARINGSNVALGAGGAGSALSAITAASGTNTIASGNNHSQIWNWALTSNLVSAFTFGETTAATSGTLANQAILSVNTLADSTATPLIVNAFGVAEAAIRVNDVSGDTTPFMVASDGAVGIGIAPAAELHVTGSGTTVRVTTADDTSDVFTLDLNGTSIYMGTRTADEFGFYQSNQNPTLIFKTDDSTHIRRDPDVAVPTAAASIPNSFLFLGNNQVTDEAFYIIGFGHANQTNPPAYIGYQSKAVTSLTNGDLIFATRSVETDTAPTVRFRIRADGVFETGGTAAVSVSSCTTFTNGLCTAGTEPLMTMTELIAEVLALRRELAALKADRR